MSPQVNTTRLFQPPALPTETISHIFNLGTHDSDVPHNALLFPLLVSHVSRRWRHIAHGTPRLWTTIVMTGLSEVQLSRNAAFLSRSRRSPLHIHLDFRDSEWNWDERAHHFRWTHMEHVLRFLLPHLPRWQHFELLTDTWEPIYTFLWHCSQLKAPLLESISLSRCNAYFAVCGEAFRPSTLKKHLPLFGGNAPALRHVSLAGVHIDWNISPLTNLQELDLSYHAQEVMPTLSEFVELLSASPALVKLTLLGWGPRFVGEVQAGFVERISLEKLRSLRFGFVDAQQGRRVLSLFRMPGLREISLEDMTSSLDPVATQEAAPILTYFASRAKNFKHVDKLTLSGLHCSAGPFALFMRAFDGLKDLSLDAMDASLLGVFDATGGFEDHICPRLARAYFRRITADAAKSFVQSRVKSLRPLLSAVVETEAADVSAERHEDIGSTKFFTVPIWESDVDE